VRTLARIYAALFLVLVPFTVVYGIGTYEPAGNVLFLGFLLAFVFLGAYAWRIVRRAGDRTPPEDRVDALPGDAVGIVGDFPSRSVWPLSIAGGATLLALGLAFNVWIALPGLLLLLTAVVGFAMETRPSGPGH
jgi:hypothetical protein